MTRVVVTIPTDLPAMDTHVLLCKIVIKEQIYSRQVTAFEWYKIPLYFSREPQALWTASNNCFYVHVYVNTVLKYLSFKEYNLRALDCTKNYVAH